MIDSFRDPETAAIWSARRGRRLPDDIQAIALRKLRLLNNTKGVGDLLVTPGNPIEALKGNRIGQHSIRINDQWRIYFVWKDNHAREVEIVEHHRPPP
jgi:proteic killer suppression protein